MFLFLKIALNAPLLFDTKSYYLTIKFCHLLGRHSILFSCLSGHLNDNVNATASTSGGGQVNYTNGGHIGQQATEDLKYHGTELVMLYDYKVCILSTFGLLKFLKSSSSIFCFNFFQAQAPDDLSVRRGDWIYADMNNQTVDGWLWAYAPKTRKYGFIPKAYARPPAMTSL